MATANSRYCELVGLVYDLPRSLWAAVYEEMGKAYAEWRTCEECHDELERGVFPSRMEPVELRCPAHGWQPPPHLAARQAPLFR